MKHAARGGRSALKRIDDDEIRAVLETILLPQLAREADRTARRRPARSRGRRRRAPRARRPPPARDRAVAGGAPRAVRRPHSGSRSGVVARLARPVGDPPGPRSGGAVGRRRARRSASPGTRRARRVAPRARRRPPARRGCAGERVQELTARLLGHPQFADAALAVWRSTSAALRAAWRTQRRMPGSAELSSSARSAWSSRPTQRCGPVCSGGSRMRRCSVSRPTARSLPR